MLRDSRWCRWGLSEQASRFNDLPGEEAERELLAACASLRWAREVTQGRPYRDLDALLEAADDAWWKLDPSDWLEAFAAHPRIGARGGHQPESSDREQSRVMEAEATTRVAIDEENRKYEARFGHVFLISAAGKTADEVLAAVRQRRHNDPDTELRVAAGEQARITRLRLERMLSR